MREDGGSGWGGGSWLPTGGNENSFVWAQGCPVSPAPLADSSARRQHPPSWEAGRKAARLKQPPADVT